MSKETKEAKKNRRRPLKPPKDEVKLPNINPMYLVTGIGLIIALLSLYYTRKTAMKEEEDENEEIEEAKEKVEEEKKTKSPKKVNKNTLWTHFMPNDTKILVYLHLTTENEVLEISNHFGLKFINRLPCIQTKCI